MKKITLKGLFFGLTILTGTSLLAQVEATGSYSGIGDVKLIKVTTDGDNGDGVGDGAIQVKGQSEAVGQGAMFTFDGSMIDGEAINIETNIYIERDSYVKARIFLYNKTDDKELTVYEDAGTVLNKTEKEKQVTFSYVANSDDVGDVLQLKFVRNDDGNTVRELHIDNISLNGTFVSNTPVNASGMWEKVGDPEITDVNDDADNGDGVGDGAIHINNNDQPDQGILYTFDSPMVEGQAYEILTHIYNNGNSYVRVKVFLYNKTDDRELAVYDDGKTLLNSGNPVEKVNFSYTATAADAGDTFQLKYIRVVDNNPARDFSIDNAYLNGTELDESTLSVEEQKLEQGIAIYPNPVSRVLTLKQSTSSDLRVKSVNLINVEGKVVHTQKNLQAINVSKFAPGLYVLKIETQKGSALTKKLIVN